ncbi:MAG: hypothetical protein AAB354_15620, partial [candidate division KSB1 bacterium]
MATQRHIMYGVLFCAWLAAGPARPQDSTFTEPKSGKTFPSKIVFTQEGKEISLTATGAIQFIKESKKAAAGKGEGSQYVMAHYMDAATRDSLQTVYAMILEKPVIKQMIFVYPNEIAPEYFRKMYSRFFSKTATPAELEQHQSAQYEFLDAACVQLDAQQQIAFRWLPDNRLVIILPNAEEKVLSP